MDSFIRSLSMNGVGYRPLPFKFYQPNNEEHLCSFHLHQLYKDIFSWKMSSLIQWQCHITTKNVIWELVEGSKLEQSFERLTGVISSMLPIPDLIKAIQKGRVATMEELKRYVATNCPLVVVPLPKIQALSTVTLLPGGVLFDIEEQYQFLPNDFRGFYVSVEENMKKMSIGFLDKVSLRYNARTDFIKIIEYFKERAI